MVTLPGIQTNVQDRFRMFQDSASILPSPTTFFNSIAGPGALNSPITFDPHPLKQALPKETSPYDSISAATSFSGGDDRGSASPASSYLATPAPSSPDLQAMIDLKPAAYQFAPVEHVHTTSFAEASLWQFAQPQPIAHQQPSIDAWYAAANAVPMMQTQAHYQPYNGPPYDTPHGVYYFVPHSVPAAAAPVETPKIQHPPTPPLEPQPIAPATSAPATILDWDADACNSFAERAESSKPTAKKTAKAASSGAPASRKAAAIDGKKKRASKQTAKRFICPQPDCGRAFARNFNMQSHLKSHFNIREFSCPMKCGKRFSRRHDCARHVAAVHEKGGHDIGSPASSTYSG